MNVTNSEHDTTTGLLILIIFGIKTINRISMKEVINGINSKKSMATRASQSDVDHC